MELVAAPQVAVADVMAAVKLLVDQEQLHKETLVVVTEISLDLHIQLVAVAVQAEPEEMLLLIHKAELVVQEHLRLYLAVQ
jgi:hypothetical protein